jgi:hypothetical protein
VVAAPGGLREWFLAERDTRTNEVLEVMLPIHEARVRLEPRSGERIDRSRAVSFTFAGWKLTARGDTIASAAFAAESASSRARSSTTARAVFSAAPAIARTVR